MMLFSEIFSNNREALQWKVPIDDICHKEDDKQGIEGQCPNHRPIAAELHDAEEGCRQQHVAEDILHGIRYGILLLPHNVAQHHSRAVARYPTPCTGPIAVLGDEENIDGKEHQSTCQREPSTIDSLVNELIPKRQVEVDTHHNLCCHHNRYYAQAFTVVGT